MIRFSSRLLVILLLFCLIGNQVNAQKPSPSPEPTPTPTPTPTPPPGCETACDVTEAWLVANRNRCRNNQLPCQPGAVNITAAVMCCQGNEVACTFPGMLPPTVNDPGGGQPLPIPTPGSPAISEIKKCNLEHEWAEIGTGLIDCSGKPDGFSSPIGSTQAEQQAYALYTDCIGRTAELDCLNSKNWNVLCFGDSQCLQEVQNYIKKKQADKEYACKLSQKNPTPTPTPTPKP